ncbi:hypothetical protein [Rugamonas sp.]|uniref:hypothetical protein n=1 Tax=Rugamonas sp. TaxID=1926287 RepID=UPI0025EEF506|nr:hypothetical protein [Rugamonas sp.]
MLWKIAISAWVTRALFKSIPRNIADDEILVRAILSPYHLKKNKLSPQAFASPPERDEVSVNRGRYVACWLAKAYAKRWVQLPADVPPKMYTGLALISARAIRRLGSEVVDTREEYMGHADLKHGLVRSRGEALAPDLRKKYDERLKQMAAEATYLKDQAPHQIPFIPIND